VDEDAPVWVVRSGSGGSLLARCVGSGIAAIHFDASLDQDVSNWSAEEFGNADAAASSTSQVKRFSQDILPEALIVSPGLKRQLAVGIVTGPYQWRDDLDLEGFHHTLPVTWYGYRDGSLLPKSVLNSLNSKRTLFRPKGEEQLRALAAMTELPPWEEEPGTTTPSSRLDDLEGALTTVFPQQSLAWADAALLLLEDPTDEAIEELAATLKAKAAAELRRHSSDASSQRFYIDGERVGLTSWKAPGLLRAVD
jgi:hypothetical protein